MSLVAVGATNLWVPTLTGYLTAGPRATANDSSIVLDADEEEAQYIGAVTTADGSSKTFGTASKIGWHVGAATITFAAGATLRVGVKQASRIDTAAGPPARATLGASAFDVWTDLVGGTDTLTALAWRDDTMSAGTPLTVNNGDTLALCFHLNIASGSAAVRFRHMQGTSPTNTTTVTTVTSGPTYTQTAVIPNVILVFEDGTVGWLDPVKVFTTIDTATAAIGEGNSIANIIQVPFPCQIDALAAGITIGTSTGDCSLELVGTPLGTPTVLASVSIDANVLSVLTIRPHFKRLPTPQTLAANTPYAISLKQTTANSVLGDYFDVSQAAYFAPNGFASTCYAANSTGGATFVAQNSGLRRYHIWMRISALDNGAGASAGGGGSVFGAAGGVIS